nr:hypothetical protein [Solidesulfovibrio aerotolerans]
MPAPPGEEFALASRTLPPLDIVMDTPLDPAATTPLDKAAATPTGTDTVAGTLTNLVMDMDTAAATPAAGVGDTQSVAATPAESAGDKPAAKARSKPAGKAKSKPVRQRAGFFSFGKTTCVGVDISQAEIVCVKLRGHDAGFVVLGAQVAAVPVGMEPGSPAFVALLQRTLTDLCGAGPTPKIWAAAHSARANLQYVTIPKVASRQVDNAVFWTAKKDMGFDEAGVVFDFERRGEIAEKGVTRLGAMAYTTPRDAITVINNDFAKAGFPLTGLTLEPFAHQNLFRRRVIAAGAPGAVANLHVGQHWSRLEIFSNGDLMFVRVIKTSMSGMEQAVLEALESRKGAAGPAPAASAPAPAGPQAPPEEMVLDLDALGTSDLGLTLEFDAEPQPEPVPAPAAAPQPAAPANAAITIEPGHARELLESVIYGCLSFDDCHPGYGLELEDIMDMLRPVASRLVRQVEMTLKHYRESLGHDPVVRLTVSGVLGGSELFLGFISDNIGLPCTPLDVLAGRALPPDMPLGGTMPPAVYSQAVGLALSDQDITPSTFFTYRERAAVRASRFLEQAVLVGLAAVLAAMALFSFAEVSKRRSLERDRDALVSQIASFGSGLDATALARKSQELRTKVESMRAYASRNRIVGVWEQALSLAPEGVGLGTLTTECGPPEKPLAKQAPGAKPPQGAKDLNAPVARLVLEGVVTGDARLFDSMLASYCVALEGSPLFEEVSVKRSELEALDGGATGLRFVLTVTLSENTP